MADKRYFLTGSDLRLVREAMRLERNRLNLQRQPVNELQDDLQPPEVHVVQSKVTIPANGFQDCLIHRIDTQGQAANAVLVPTTTTRRVFNVTGSRLPPNTPIFAVRDKFGTFLAVNLATAAGLGNRPRLSWNPVHHTFQNLDASGLPVGGPFGGCGPCCVNPPPEHHVCGTVCSTTDPLYVVGQKFVLQKTFLTPKAVIPGQCSGGLDSGTGTGTGSHHQPPCLPADTVAWAGELPNTDPFSRTVIVLRSDPCACAVGLLWGPVFYTCQTPCCDRPMPKEICITATSVTPGTAFNKVSVTMAWNGDCHTGDGRYQSGAVQEFPAGGGASRFISFIVDCRGPGGATRVRQVVTYAGSLSYVIDAATIFGETTAGTGTGTGTGSLNVGTICDLAVGGYLFGTFGPDPPAGQGGPGYSGIGGNATYIITVPPCSVCGNCQQVITDGAGTPPNVLLTIADAAGTMQIIGDPTSKINCAAMNGTYVLPFTGPGEGYGDCSWDLYFYVPGNPLQYRWRLQLWQPGVFFNPCPGKPACWELSLFWNGNTSDNQNHITWTGACGGPGFPVTLTTIPDTGTGTFGPGGGGDFHSFCLPITLTLQDTTPDGIIYDGHGNVSVSLPGVAFTATFQAYSALTGPCCNPFNSGQVILNTPNGKTVTVELYDCQIDTGT